MIYWKIKEKLGFEPDEPDEEVLKVVKALIARACKPCWEIKYCPYGAFVEEFPLLPPHEECLEEIPEEICDMGCTVFGHMCPVFFVSEGYTETAEPRRRGRYIPFEVKMRVVRRDNHTCQVCGKHLLDNEVEFDHIIPLSKGGSSEDHNVFCACLICCAHACADKRCRIYKKRPLGCHLYPVVYLTDEGAIIDELCPMGQTISEQELRAKVKTLNQLLKKIDS